MMSSTTTRTVAIAVILIALTPAALGAAPQEVDLTNQFRTAGVTVDRLQVYEVSGIVILRGRVDTKEQAEALGQYANTLGYTRIANLIQIAPNNDAEITRAAERELTIHRSLDGCRFRVTTDQGVIKVAGSVRHELQKDVAMQVLRSIDGAKSVQVNLDRF
jgi:osmotically-inducible protein OsmY